MFAKILCSLFGHDWELVATLFGRTKDVEHIACSRCHMETTRVKEIS
jgi:hypothetical protein